MLRNLLPAFILMICIGLVGCNSVIVDNSLCRNQKSDIFGLEGGYQGNVFGNIFHVTFSKLENPGEYQYTFRGEDEDGKKQTFTTTIFTCQMEGAPIMELPTDINGDQDRTGLPVPNFNIGLLEMMEFGIRMTFANEVDLKILQDAEIEYQVKSGLMNSYLIKNRIEDPVEVVFSSLKFDPEGLDSVVLTRIQ